MWWDGVFASLSISCYMDFLVLYLLVLGASTATVGVFASLNSAAALAAPLLGAWLVERSARRKLWVVLGPGGLARIPLLLMAAIPLVFSGQAAVACFLAASAIQSFGGSVGLPAYSSLLADVVPIQVRGRFLGAQMLAGNVIRLAIVPLAGWLIGWVGGVSGYQLAWIIAALAGLAATRAYARIPEPACAEGRDLVGLANAGSGGSGWRALRRDHLFVAFCLINVIWTAGVQGIVPFFTVHMASDLGFSVGTIAYLTTASTLASILITRLMGNLVDRKGAAVITAGSMLAMVPTPLFWMLARTPFQVGLVQAYGNLAWTGAAVAATPLILMLTPVQYRSRYIAVFNTANGVAAIIAPLVAGWLYVSFGFQANATYSLVVRGLGALGFLALWRSGRLVAHVSHALPPVAEHLASAPGGTG
ncbi:MAG: MFS transporter [Anaerolineae bacterium]